MKRGIVAVVALMLAFLGVGLALHTYVEGNPRGPLAFAAIAAALISFFWFLSDSRAGSVSTTLDESVLRRAITGSIVVEYLVLVGIVTFWESEATALPPLTQTLLTSFTTVVGVVIAFYFGSSAYLEAKRRTETSPGTAAENDKVSAAQRVAADAPQARAAERERQALL